MTPKGRPRATDATTVRTTLDMPEELWRRAKIRAVEEHRDLRAILLDALTAYLKTKPQRREG